MPSTALAILCCPVPSAAAAGGRIHRNDEYGIAVKFPAGLRVCEALSGGFHPIGFFAWIGRRTDCDAPQPPSASAINVTAGYNTPFRRSPTLTGCRNGEVPRGSRIDLRGLVFPRLRSIRCAIRHPDGSLEILVAAQGGRWSRRYRSPELRAPLIDYSAVLKTRPERLRRDMAMFRSLLANTAITPIVQE